MVQLSRVTGIIIVLIIGLFIQILFAFADTRDTPSTAVVEFSKAYFMLDKSMAERICNERQASDEIDVIDQHIYLAEKQASERGFDINLVKYKLDNIETEIITKNDNRTQVRITGKRRVSINPVYSIVAKIFDLAATHEIDEVINVIKEDGKWKVCGDLFALPTN
jgi:hypothetical protein